jgi:hypothetical protein
MTHAQRRAAERYGLRVRGQDFAQIIEQVQLGVAIKLGPRGRRKSIYLVTVQGQEAIVVYNRLDKWVLTFLPPEWAWSRCPR